LDNQLSGAGSRADLLKINKPAGGGDISWQAPAAWFDMLTVCFAANKDLFQRRLLYYFYFCSREAGRWKRAQGVLRLLRCTRSCALYIGKSFSCVFAFVLDVHYVV